MIRMPRTQSCRIRLTLEPRGGRCSGVRIASVQWYGDEAAQIELLDTNCTLIGVFERADDDTYVVPGVSGLEGEVDPSGTRMDKWNTRKIKPNQRIRRLRSSVTLKQ